MNKSERIVALIDHFTGGNKARFAALLGVAPQTISTWLKRDTYDAELIFAKCDSISAAWLLTGQGPMLRDSSTPSASVPEPIDEKSRLRGRIEQLECENERLRSRNEELITEVAVQKQEIAILRAQAKASAASANSRTA